ncbi:MAG: ABC transporter permease [Syntrophobacteraceae bacterium]|nr:ABC transporter permease [Syntrophobacteraceae bacterium]
MTGQSLLRLILPLLLACAWEIVALYLNKPMILPRLESVVKVLLHPTQKVLITGSLAMHMCISVVRVLLGFFLAASVAIPLGIWMGHCRLADKLFDSLIELLRPIPPLAWIPLILAWFGIKGIVDWAPQLSESILLSNIQYGTVVIIMIGAFFPVLLNTAQGVRSIPDEYIESARTLGARRFSLLFKVLIPASAPAILTGLRIGMGIGWMCLVAAEMMPGSSSGLGYLIWYAYEFLRTDVIVAGMIIIGFIGFLVDRGFRWLENRIIWRGRMS